MLNLRAEYHKRMSSFSFEAFAFMLNFGSPKETTDEDTVNAMTEERFSGPLYDKINKIMEDADGNVKK